MVPIAQSDLFKAKMRKWPKIVIFKTFIKKESGFGENNVQSVIASFCLFFRAFSQINSSASWPTVGGGVRHLLTIADEGGRGGLKTSEIG